MKQVNVLVTGSGSLYGVAIVQSLVKRPFACKVVCCDTDPMTLGLYLADKGYLVPPVKEKDAWLKSIIDICLKEEINCILVGSSKEIEIFAESKEYIAKATGAKVFVNSQVVLNKCLDKWQTIKFLRNKKFYYPETIRWPEDKNMLTEFLAKVSFPVVAKPRLGAGSKGLAILKDRQELNNFLYDKKHYIVQEYIPETKGEFTVGVCIGSEGKIISSIALKRTLRDGMTMVAFADEYADICHYCEEVAQKLKAYGPLNLQLRIKDGKPYVFEINPRFSSSTGMRIALGVNESELLIRSEIIGEKVTKPKVVRSGVIRQHTDYVISEDQLTSFSLNKWFEIPSQG